MRRLVDISIYIDMFRDMDAHLAVDTSTLAKTFQALADMKRLEILSLLTDGERCVCELTSVVGAKQPLLSFHLKTLREAGLVRHRRRGKWMYYSINYESLDEIRVVLDSIAHGRSHTESCCCESVCCPPESCQEQQRSDYEETNRG